jgi:hypothetical protein
MKAAKKQAQKKSERGVALIIAIFTMMLISVIATALILNAGTASAIKANYKNSMKAFYDAKAGLEEGRSRLWTFHADAKGNLDAITTPTIPSYCVSNPLPVSQVCYIVNPDPTSTETVDPTNSTNPYVDTEYANEKFPGPANVPTPVNSDSQITSLGLSGPLYKWVRITATTEQSSGIHVSGNAGLDSTDPLYYDGTQESVWKGVGAPPNASQVLTVTALAMTPNGGYSGRRLLQYTVAQRLLAQALASNGSMPTLNQTFPAALTLDGNGVSYSGGSKNSVVINGNDSDVSGSGVPAIAYTNSGDTPPTCSCQAPTGTQDVQNLSLPTLMQTPSGLDGMVNAITQDATVVITPPSGTVADQSSLPTTMSATNPMIAVVNGDFHLTHAGGSGAFTGYGLLLVTGTFYYDPDDSWYGIIMVVGKGIFDGSQNGKNGQINGAVLVANTKDSAGNLLKTLGPASYNQTGGGNGIQYGSSWFGKVQTLAPYQVLSFREIQQTQ